ncbi:hypothetical protein BJ165DRAFT_1494161, partial [Panaeolus papilionaceus]
VVDVKEEEEINSDWSRQATDAITHHHHRQSPNHRKPQLCLCSLYDHDHILVVELCRLSAIFYIDVKCRLGGLL